MGIEAAPCHVVTLSEHQRKIGLRAAGALLALVLGWLAPALALASFVPDVCHAECCVAEGHCCCSPRHALVEGQAADGHAEVGAAQLARPCPNNCATPAGSASAFSRQSECARGYEAFANRGLPPPCARRACPHHPVRSNPSSPRTPPALS